MIPVIDETASQNYWRKLEIAYRIFQATTMKYRLNFFFFQLIIPLFIGTAAFFLVLGPRILDPTNIAWLGSGDPAQHFLGWHFFRYSPWTFPIGLNPNFGLELSNAIVYSDSNPLFAFLFKPFSAFMPEVFQYFGFWLLTCFVLQAWFGWKLIGLISDNPFIKALGSGFFVFSVPMIGRMGGHLSLSAHFLIVAGLYLTFHPDLKRRGWAWCALLTVASLIHAYLFAMVLLLWIANILGTTKAGKLTAKDAIFEFLFVLLVVAIAMWQAGYFSVGRGASAAGFGYYRMNFLSIFDSSGWSYVLKDIPQGDGDYEGLNFLGLGVIFLALSAFPILLKCNSGLGLAISRMPFLLLVLAGLTIFSLSNNIGIGSFELKYPFPHQLIGIANIFRASGRMFWPVFYAIVFTIIFFIVRGYDSRTAIYLLGIAFVIQVVDTSAAWKGIRTHLMTQPSSTWNSALTDPFWNEAGRRYKKVRWILPDNHSLNWKSLAAYAGMHGLATDAIYLARIDRVALENARQTAIDALRTGKYDPNSLFIMNDKAFRRAAISIDPSQDTLAQINGLNLLAPGWKKCNDCSSTTNEVKLADLVPRVEIGKRILLNESNGANAKYLLDGWSTSEPWGTWSDADSAEIIFPVLGKVHSVAIEARVFVTEAHPKQDVEIKVNDVTVLTTSLTKSSEQLIEVSLPEVVQQKVLKSGLMLIELKFFNAARPQDVGAGNDDRKLAIGLHSITVN